mmetsp:Transcript_6767/g.8365  ORF Transcript_6767/g.8365 Transcript_6767/m.8365 type:complete len:87 (-) Transcript_6767:178-438(-)
MSRLFLVQKRFFPKTAVEALRTGNGRWKQPSPHWHKKRSSFFGLPIIPGTFLGIYTLPCIVAYMLAKDLPEGNAELYEKNVRRRNL